MPLRSSSFYGIVWTDARFHPPRKSVRIWTCAWTKCLLVPSVLGVQRGIGAALQIPYPWFNLGKVQLLGTVESLWLLASCSNYSLSAGNRDGAHVRDHVTLMHVVPPTTHLTCTKLSPNTMRQDSGLLFWIMLKSGSSPSQTSPPCFSFPLSPSLHFYPKPLSLLLRIP